MDRLQAMPTDGTLATTATQMLVGVSVQRGTTITAANHNTVVNISPINPSRSFLMFFNSGSTITPATLNPDNITFASNFGGTANHWQIISFT